ncbi:MAG: DoxX family protein [Humibacillus sp.]|nr:DoxX family protein [Humibacillus sp.]MDN5778997.1 DoxX family protein [Humibacillus sp.]
MSTTSQDREHNRANTVDVPTDPAARGTHAPPTRGTEPELAPRAGKWMAVTRIALGLTFLWAFFDKMFGLGYSTPSARSWISGGSPTKGFLSHVEVGPLSDFFQGLAGNTVVDWVFMLGLLGIGLAFTFGIAMWISAISGAVMLMMMWAAEWPLAQMTSSGQPSGSTNPIIDYHLIYALTMITLALLGAGRVWGLARQWRATSLGRVLP